MRRRRRDRSRRSPPSTRSRPRSIRRPRHPRQQRRLGAHGRFADADPARLRPIMEVNFFAPVEFIREALPLLREGCNRSSSTSARSSAGAAARTRANTPPANSRFTVSAKRCEPNSRGLESTSSSSPPAPPRPNSWSTCSKARQTPLEGVAACPPEEVARAIVRAIEHGRHEIIPAGAPGY